ncbi:MAG: hypothetical protein M3512_03960 [Bacteroidota bacterium]|nr:hypothetical protein [Bacteroidota bacterium]
MSVFIKESLLKYLPFTLIILLFISISLPSYSQLGDPFGSQSNEIKRSPIRKALNLFSLSASSGYGLTLYRHKIQGQTILQKAGGTTFIIPSYSASAPNIGFSSWLQNAQPISDVRRQNEDFIVNTDTVEVGYRGIGHSVPLNLSLHVDISNFRIGGGVTAEFHTIGNLFTTSYQHELLAYEPESRSSLFTRWFGTIGYKVHNYWDYSFVPEVQFGKLNLGSNYNKAQIEKGMFFNFGMSIEKNYSEYFRTILRPSIDFKNYTLNISETASILHRQPAFYLTAGISLNYPEVPRCRINSCQTQLKHVHGGKEFRGQPIWKKQNPKYGENHQDLIKYKGKNKRIRSPF